jgi:hypothetical protein
MPRTARPLRTRKVLIEAGAIGLLNIRPYATSAQAVLNMAR